MGTFTTKMVWDGTGDGHWDVVFTEMTEGRACVLATIPFDEWISLARRRSRSKASRRIPVKLEEVRYKDDACCHKQHRIDVKHGEDGRDEHGGGAREDRRLARQGPCTGRQAGSEAGRPTTAFD